MTTISSYGSANLAAYAALFAQAANTSSGSTTAGTTTAALDPLSLSPAARGLISLAQLLSNADSGSSSFDVSLASTAAPDRVAFRISRVPSATETAASLADPAQTLAAEASTSLAADSLSIVSAQPVIAAFAASLDSAAAPATFSAQTQSASATVGAHAIPATSGFPTIDAADLEATMLDPRGNLHRVVQLDAWTGSATTMISADQDFSLQSGDEAYSVQVFAADGTYQSVTGGNGDDSLAVEGGFATVDGGEGNNYLRVGDNSLALARGGDDVIEIGANSTLDGGGGNNILRGGAGSTFRAGAGRDIIDAAGDGTTISSGGGADLVRALNGAVIDGGAGDDEIFAGDNAVVTGGAGNDRHYLGQNGTIVFGRGSGHDFASGYALDASAGTLDHGSVLAAYASLRYGGNSVMQSAPLAVTIRLGNDVAVGDLSITQNGSDLTIAINGTRDALTIKDFSSAILDFNGQSLAI